MQHDQVARVHGRLAAAPELSPVTFGECVAPDSLTVTGEKRWRLRAGTGRDTCPVGAGALRVTSLHGHPLLPRPVGVQPRNPVRHYLRRGLWVTSWKDSPGFARLSCLPR